jgi:PAS domain S-box-containing protein
MRLAKKSVSKRAAVQKQVVSRVISPEPPCPEQSENLFREVLEGLDIGVATVTPDGKILWANAPFAETLGVQARLEPVGMRLHTLITPRSWEPLDTALRMARRGPTEGEMTIETKSWSRRVQLKLAPIAAGDGTVIQLVARDVTKIVQTSESLKQTEASLHTLSGRLLRLQDEERRRIARDLHDITGQELAVVVMTLSHLVRTVRDPGVDAAMAITEAIEIVRKVEQEIRTLSYLLHPPLLDELGLISALKWYIEGFNKRTGLEVDLVAPHNFKRLSPEKETALFRVVQESLTNVLRHSGSQRARIEIGWSDGDVQISVEDEGKGVTSEILQKLNSRKEILGVGIPGIRERLRQFGGTLRVYSGNRGTAVVAVVPAKGIENPTKPSPSFEEGHEVEIPTPIEAADRKRILVVDDHEMIRHGIRSLLSAYADLEICGEASDGIEAVAKAEDLQPDLVIMDLSLPRLGGLAAVRHIKDRGNKTRILIFTTYDFEGLESMADLAGCDGIVLKRRANQDLIRAVRAVLSGKRFFSRPEPRAVTAV